MTLTGVSPSLAPTVVSPLERAILETLAYSDIFDYPLTLDELHRYLHVSVSHEIIDIAALSGERAFSSLEVEARVQGVAYYFLPNRASIVDIRLQRETASLSSFRRAVIYGRIIGYIPFVRMVGMTGSLAMLNLSKNADMDFMLITTPKRLWIARAFAVTFGRIMRLFGDRICVNLLVSENALAWPRHDLYSAREMGQMIPLVGMSAYQRLRAANPWVDSFLPNATSAPERTPQPVKETGSFLQRLIEFPLRGKLGAWLDNVTMEFQQRKILRERGTNADANFTADVCQGNFHDHRKWADEYFRARLLSLGLEDASR